MRSPCRPSRLRTSTSLVAGGPEPVRQPGVALRRLSGPQGDVVVGEDQPHLSDRLTGVESGDVGGIPWPHGRSTPMPTDPRHHRPAPVPRRRDTDSP
jgi:hypothetical protein